jgi:hypothetical protein
MTINAQQLREFIVTPVNKGLNMWSEEADDLVLGTMAQESQLGTYIKQISGPALGPWQMEPRTHDDIWSRYLPQNPKIANDLMILCSFQSKPLSKQLIHNLFYAAAMCRIFYRRIPDAIPKSLEQQADFYKRWYNTSAGAATPAQYIANFKRYVIGDADGKGKAKTQ